MNNPIVKNIVRLLLLILVQGMVLNNIHLMGYMNPYLYVYFILLLPFEIPGWLLLLSAFAAGLGVDLFAHSPGMHAAASVFMAFCRPGITRFVASRKEFEPGMSPSVSSQGFRWFFIYALLLILLHHTALFFLEVLRFSEFWQTLQRISLSTLFTLALVLLLELFFYKKD